MFQGKKKRGSYAPFLPTNIGIRFDTSILYMRIALISESYPLRLTPRMPMIREYVHSFRSSIVVIRFRTNAHLVRVEIGNVAMVTWPLSFAIMVDT